MSTSEEKKAILRTHRAVLTCSSDKRLLLRCSLTPPLQPGMRFASEWASVLLYTPPPSEKKRPPFCFPFKGNRKGNFLLVLLLLPSRLTKVLVVTHTRQQQRRRFQLSTVYFASLAVKR